MGILSRVARDAISAATATNPLGGIAQAAGELATRGTPEPAPSQQPDPLATLATSLDQLDAAAALQVAEEIVLERGVASFGADETATFLQELIEEVARAKLREERHAARRQRLAGSAATLDPNDARPRPPLPRGGAAERPAVALPPRPAQSRPPPTDAERQDDFERMVADLIHAEEGWRTDVYLDTRGNPTVGCGHRLTTAQRAKFPVGTVLDEERLDDWLDHDLSRAADECDELFSAEALAHGGPARHAVLVSMIFQMGAAKVSKFTHFHAAFEGGRYDDAATEMEMNSDRSGPSPWAIETPHRVAHAAETMRTGALHFPKEAA